MLSLYLKDETSGKGRNAQNISYYIKKKKRDSETKWKFKPFPPLLSARLSLGKQQEPRIVQTGQDFGLPLHTIFSRG